jgi:hypothetical protein
MRQLTPNGEVDFFGQNRHSSGGRNTPLMR